MDLDTGIFTPGQISRDTHWSLPTDPGVLQFDSNWVFDDSTEITVCSDVGSAAPIGCTIYNFKVANSAEFFADFVTKGIFPNKFGIHPV